MTEARLINEAVVIFVKRGSRYLLLRRNEEQTVDPGVYNGVGGRVKPGETCLDTAIRKLREETGFEAGEQGLVLLGLAREEEYEQGDWTMAYFGYEAGSDQPPIGNRCGQGDLEWVEEAEVLKKPVVEDLYHLFPEIIRWKGVFYATWKRKNSTAAIEGMKIGRSS